MNVSWKHVRLWGRYIAASEDIVLLLVGAYCFFSWKLVLTYPHRLYKSILSHWTFTSVCSTVHMRQCVVWVHLLYLKIRTAVVILGPVFNVLIIINSALMNFIEKYKQHKNGRFETRSYFWHLRYYTQPTARNSWSVATPGEQHWVLLSPTPVKAFARDYVITGVGLSVCLSVFVSVCYHDN